MASRLPPRRRIRRRPGDRPHRRPTDPPTDAPDDDTIGPGPHASSRSAGRRGRAAGRRSPARTPSDAPGSRSRRPRVPGSTSAAPCGRPGRGPATPARVRDRPDRPGPPGVHVTPGARWRVAATRIVRGPSSAPVFTAPAPALASPTPRRRRDAAAVSALRPGGHAHGRPLRRGGANLLPDRGARRLAGRVRVGAAPGPRAGSYVHLYRYAGSGGLELVPGRAGNGCARSPGSPRPAAGSCSTSAGCRRSRSRCPDMPTPPVARRRHGGRDGPLGGARVTPGRPPPRR